MADKEMQFLNAPQENLQTWDHVWKLMIISGGVTIAVLLILGAVFV